VKPRITANQVTFVRLVLLPIPVAMVYRGGLSWMLGALGVYVLLGLTDALDGMLARRHGSTPLGELLDPIADKIFLVAAYLPLADLRAVSIGFVSLMFVRELAVTVLRSIALQEKIDFKTSRIAKLKTTVQMAGAGFILLIRLFPSDRVILFILGTAAALATVPILVALLRGRRPGWRPISGGVLIGAVAVARLLVGAPTSMMLIMLTIVGFTLLSGGEYVWRMRSALAARFRRAPLDALRLAGQSLAIPVLLLPMVGEPAAPFFLVLLIMALLAAELAVGGLDNSLARSGSGRGPWPDLLRSGSQAAAGVTLLALLPGPLHPVWVSIPLWIALGVTVADLAARLARNSAVFRTSPDLP
jgi:CDP-diacylglycerol--glycerol-3-phosphate 3-phosphatidyltransferase